MTKTLPMTLPLQKSARRQAPFRMLVNYLETNMVKKGDWYTWNFGHNDATAAIACFPHLDLYYAMSKVKKVRLKKEASALPEAYVMQSGVTGSAARETKEFSAQDCTPIIRELMIQRNEMGAELDRLRAALADALTNVMTSPEQEEDDEQQDNDDNDDDETGEEFAKRIARSATGHNDDDDQDEQQNNDDDNDDTEEESFSDLMPTRNALTMYRDDIKKLRRRDCDSLAYLGRHIVKKLTGRAKGSEGILVNAAQLGIELKIDVNFVRQFLNDNVEGTEAGDRRPFDAELTSRGYLITESP